MTLIKLNEVKEKIPLSDSSIERLIQKGKFPAPVDVGVNVNLWRESDIDNWIISLPFKKHYKRCSQFNNNCKCCKLNIGGVQ